MKTTIFVIVTFHLSLFTLHLSQAQIIHVPADQPTIQGGINAAADGDTVLVADGTYYENINFMGKAITLASHYITDSDTNHINNTVINGSQPVNPDFASVVTFITGEDTNSVLCGFTITGGTGTLVPEVYVRIGGGIICYNAMAKILNNHVTGNQCEYENHAFGGGIGSYMETGTSLIVLHGNKISGNQSVTENGTAFGGGIMIRGGAVLSDNIIEDNESDCQSSSNFSFGGGIYVISPNSPPDTLKLFNNIIRNNTALAENCVANGGGLYVKYSSCLLVNNVVENNHVTGGPYPFWSHGGGIHIENADADLHSNTIRLNALTGYNGSGGGLNLKVSNSILTDNEISYNSISAKEADGAGIHMHNSGKTTINGNIVSYNRSITDSVYWGVGVSCINPLGRNQFSNNEIVGNEGPIYTIPPNVVKVGAGGGLCIHDAFMNEVIVDGNYFDSDTAKNGAFYARDSYHLILSNNLFTNNVGYRGSAIGIASLQTSGEELHPSVVNNTIVHNEAVHSGGATLWLSNIINIPVVHNCIFFDNNSVSGKDILNVYTDTLHISYTNIDTAKIQATWSGTGNIHGDPLFIDPENGNYCIDSCGSPCVAAGMDSLKVNNTWYYCPDHDLRNFSRPYPFSSPPDIGAYEVDYCVGIGESIIQNSEFKIQNYPNPTRGMFNVQFTVYNVQFVSLRIYDLYGREVAVVLDEVLPAGEHVVRYDASGMPAGIYLIRLQAGREAATGKVVVVR